MIRRRSIDLDINDLVGLLSLHDIAPADDDDIVLVISQHGEEVRFDLDDIHVVLEVEMHTQDADPCRQEDILPIHPVIR